jgi:hypothetical protein
MSLVYNLQQTATTTTTGEEAVTVNHDREGMAGGKEICALYSVMAGA